MKTAKQNSSVASPNHMIESVGSNSTPESAINLESAEKSDNHVESNGSTESAIKSINQMETHGNLNKVAHLSSKGKTVFSTQSNKTHDSHSTKTNVKLGGQSELSDKVATDSSDFLRKSGDFSDSQSFSPEEIHQLLDGKKSRKLCVARITNNTSISVDLRLSRGIAQVHSPFCS